MKKITDRYDGMLPGVSLEQEARSRAFLRATGLVRVSGGGSSFAEEGNAASVFQIKLSNIDTVEHIVAIHPGALISVEEIASVAGVTVSAIAKDGVIIASKLSGSTRSNTTLGFFQRFVNANPTRITKLQISASSEEQLGETITLAKINPILKLGTQDITPANFKNASETNAKLVSIDLKHYQLDDQSVWYLTLLPGNNITINAFLGASRNDAATLEQLAYDQVGE